jgi:UTP--glucose-1-phosphate uridylyltransferase
MLEETRPGKGGEIQLTDAICRLAKETATGVYGVELEGTRYDAGDKLGYLEANIAYALKRPELRDDVRKLLSSMLART